MTYIVQSRRNRETHTLVEVLDLDAPDSEFENEGERWATTCVDHAVIVTHPTRALAVWHAPAPSDWCEECHEIIDNERETS